MRLTSAFVSFALVATTPMVVFSTARGAAPRRCISAPLRSSARASANVPSGLRTPAITLPVSGSIMSPAALTATIAATTRPLGMRSAALPRPPFIDVPGPPILPTVAPAPAPTVPIDTGAVGRRFAPPCSRSRRRDGSWRCCRSADRTGSRPARSAPWRCRTSQPMWCSSSHFDVPVAASRPNALPPDRTIALTLSTMLSGLSRSVSRVPGAPPRCETPPGTPSPSTRMTVQPVVPPGSVTLPTLMPVDGGQRGVRRAGRRLGADGAARLRARGARPATAARRFIR